VLCKEIGAVDTARFIGQFTRRGYGDYTAERRRLFEGLTVDDVVRQVKRGRAAAQRKTR